MPGSRRREPCLRPLALRRRSGGGGGGLEGLGRRPAEDGAAAAAAEEGGEGPSLSSAPGLGLGLAAGRGAAGTASAVVKNPLVSRGTLMRAVFVWILKKFLKHRLRALPCAVF